MQASQFYYVAATGYNCDAYGANAYGECSTAASTGGTSGTGGTPGGSGTPGGGILADAGYDVLIPLALAVAIAGAAVVLLVKRLIRHKKSQKSGGGPKDLV